MTKIIFYVLDNRYICPINGFFHFHFKNKPYKLILNPQKLENNFTPK